MQNKCLKAFFYAENSGVKGFLNLKYSCNISLTRLSYPYGTISFVKKEIRTLKISLDE
jgi:hypothetical protein